MVRAQDIRRKRTYDYDELEGLIASLLDESSQGTAIIVEGRRDEMALRSLGISGPVIMASSRSALDLAEAAARSYKSVIVLTDWDEKGDEMAQSLDRYLRSAGRNADVETRSRLKRLVKKEIKDVQSLDHYVERMREIHGSKL